MLTKKHFKAIADVVSKCTTPNQGTIPKFRFCQSLADYFGEQNDRFDRDKFMLSCYPTTKGELDAESSQL